MEKNTIKEETALELSEIAEDWSGINPIAENPRVEANKRLERDIAHIKDDMERRAAGLTYRSYKAWERSQMPFRTYENANQDRKEPIKTEFKTKSGSHYVVNWKDHTISGDGLSKGIHKFTEINDEYDKMKQMHSVLGDRLTFTLDDGKVYSTSPVIAFNELEVAEKAIQSMEGFVQEDENHRKDFRDNSLYNREEDEKSGKIIVSTLSGSKYIVDTDNQTIEKTDGTFGPYKYDFIEKNDENRLEVNLEDGRTLRTSEILYHEEYSDRDRSEEREEREEFSR